ncbi:hypothetical protein [Gloeothece verrucosa]|uniref:Uncharacterized protein n=1 Tax=Gloeothece verrucosa (strain PCC 7822) TaxID=497965 RepID=E0U5L2_GLOV7|nr:hypothetical protein [Gloeothece verrucosa]ADN14725.1 hypothetical protein Cyan7822_2761 [Gloeothece verrucosa PCC 7822]
MAQSGPTPPPTPTPPPPTPDLRTKLGYTFENVDGNIVGSFETTPLPPNDFFGDSKFGGDISFPDDLSEGEFNFESTLEKTGDTFSNLTSFTADTLFGPLTFSPLVNLENVVPQNFPANGLGINLKTPDGGIEINVGLTANFRLDGFEPKIDSFAAGFKVSIKY